MAGKKRNKDHLKGHAGVDLVEVVSPPSSDSGDPLCWWTQHKTQACKVDLREFAEGQTENPWGDDSGLAFRWPGPFTGRASLIRELAPHLNAKTFLAEHSVRTYLASLRYWWRLFDALEATPLPGDKHLARVESVADLNEFHEAGYHQAGGGARHFERFRDLANNARKALGLRELFWIAPDRPEPERQLINDEMARLLRIALKRNWGAVRKNWALRDRVRDEADRRDRGEPAEDLGPEGEKLLINCREFRRIANETGKILPSSEELADGRNRRQLYTDSRLSFSHMRTLQFPTAWELDAAMHVALLDSGWNPSTLLNVDASDPNCVAVSLKDSASITLRAEEDSADTNAQTLSVSAPKPRARGKLQTCHGLAKNTCSAPAIVRAMIQRTEPLRELLRDQLRDALAEYAKLLQASADSEDLGEAFKRVQALKRGVVSVWCYVDPRGRVLWAEKVGSLRYSFADGAKYQTYLARVIEQLAATGQIIGNVTPSDLRDLYARRVIRSGGSIIALMLALGHSQLATTAKYLDNNVFREENDEVVRRFMDHLFGQLEDGRVDLTILAQLSRHSPLTDEMAARLLEYRALMRSRLDVGCIDPRHPPLSVEPDHVPEAFCGGQRCTLCPNARYLPESLHGFAMRAEELMVIADLIPREAWLRLRFDDEQQVIEALLEGVYPPAEVAKARAQWRIKIQSGQHRIPGIRVPVQGGTTA